MTQFFSFFIVLLTAVLFSHFFTRIKVPWVVALIFGGLAIGPYGLGIFSPDETISFLANIGLVFLMFMAGLETRFSDIAGLKGKIVFVAFLNSFIPALIGVVVGLVLGYDWTTALFLGVIFMSSSIAILIPSFQTLKIIGSQFGKLIVGATIAIDALSLILLSIFLQIESDTSLTLILISYPFIILILISLAWLIPKIRSRFKEQAEEQDLFEKELRFILLILIGLVVFFELVGLHAIIAGFFAGLILAKSVKSKITKAKLHAVSYGLFIPLFFVVVGSNIDLDVFSNAKQAILLVSTVVLASIIAKALSGWLAGKILGYTNKESLFIGISTTPSLSTTLAVAFLGFGQGILSQDLLTAIIILSVVTSILAPIFITRLGPAIKSHQVLLRGHEQE